MNDRLRSDLVNARHRYLMLTIHRDRLQRELMATGRRLRDLDRQTKRENIMRQHTIIGDHFRVWWGGGWGVNLPYWPHRVAIVASGRLDRNAVYHPNQVGVSFDTLHYCCAKRRAETERKTIDRLEATP